MQSGRAQPEDSKHDLKQSRGRSHSEHALRTHITTSTGIPQRGWPESLSGERRAPQRDPITRPLRAGRVAPRCRTWAGSDYRERSPITTDGRPVEAVDRTARLTTTEGERVADACADRYRRRIPTPSPRSTDSRAQSNTRMDRPVIRPSAS